MPMHYANESAEQDPCTLPNILVTRFSAEEVAETMEDALWEFEKRNEYRLASMNRRTREKMIEAMVEELSISGGFMWSVCYPGCLPDSDWSGPFATEEEALSDARNMLSDD